MHALTTLLLVSILAAATPCTGTGETPSPTDVNVTMTNHGNLLTWSPVVSAGAIVSYTVYGSNASDAWVALSGTLTTHALVDGTYAEYGVAAVIEGSPSMVVKACVIIDTRELVTIRPECLGPVPPY